MSFAEPGRIGATLLTRGLSADLRADRAVLGNRAALVDELYASPLSSRIISIES